MNPLDESAEPNFEEGKQYSIRPTEKAVRDVEAAIDEMSRWNGTEADPIPDESAHLALEWFESFEKARQTLANYPQRCPVIPEQQHFVTEIRHLLFRRASGAPTWRILFSTQEGDGEISLQIAGRYSETRGGDLGA
ncbi:hypothetical protein [Armatimonas sp.]|uniref:hypothetical protein n=1 Tax=Armatimonas sp. TaxID=1872638 RepID=UPI003752B94D